MNQRPTMARLATALGLAGLLAACAVPPESTEPRLSVPVDTQFPAAPDVAGPVAAALPWRDFLTDPRTQALVDLALQRNRDLRIALLNVEQARAVLGAQQAERQPSVGAGIGAERTSVSSSYSAGLRLASFELDLFGRVKALSEAAAARVLASDEARRAVQLSLITAVADAELALRADDALIALTAQVLGSREESLRLVRIKFDGGAAGEAELRAGESLVAAARAQAQALERQRALHLNALVLLAGGPLPADLPPPRALSDHRLPTLPAGLPSDVLLQRPDVRQAEQQLIAAQANIGAARAAFFPRISLTASVGAASNQLSSLFDNFAWSFAPQLLQPLFDGGRNQANFEGAQAARDIAVAQYERVLQTAFREVADALAARATLGAQREAQQAQAQAESRRLAVVERLLDAGAANLLDRLDAERAALAARQAVLQLELAERQNALLLYRVLAGGTSVPG